MFLAQRTVIAAIAVTVFVPLIAASYADSCYDISLSGTTLYATCTTADGGSLDNGLDINNCVANYNGVLTPATNGDYSGSCQNCGLDSGHVLDCDCRNDEGGYPETLLDLGSFINNYNGVLAC